MGQQSGDAVFLGYAQFYDTFYAEKDYEREVQFVLELYRRSKNGVPSHVLDLGCGTGGHMVPLARQGISVHGVDRSSEMVQRAESKLREACCSERATLTCGDIRTFRQKATYDLVISMFAVIGYLTSNDDLLQGFATARSHLTTGGLFIFDVWHGSAVLSTLPETRIKEFSDANGSILRLVTPQLDCVRQVVSVDYRILTLDHDAVKSDIREKHDMRYFFVQEVKGFLSQAGFRTSHVCEFLDPDRTPDLDCWNLTVVAEAAPV